MGLWEAVGNNDAKAFEIAMQSTLDSSDVYRALEAASRYHHPQYIAALCPYITREAWENAFWRAAALGHAACVTALLTSGAPALPIEASIAFEQCVQNSLLVGHLQCFTPYTNHAACLEILAPPLPTARINLVLNSVAGQCSMDVLNVLLKHGTPKNNKSRPLQKAFSNQNQEHIDRLYPLSNPKIALNAMQKNVLSRSEDWMPLFERIESERIKRVLNTKIDATARPTKTAKL